MSKDDVVKVVATVARTEEEAARLLALKEEAIAGGIDPQQFALLVNEQIVAREKPVPLQSREDVVRETSRAICHVFRDDIQGIEQIVDESVIDRPTGVDLRIVEIAVKLAKLGYSLAQA